MLLNKRGDHWASSWAFVLNPKCASTSVQEALAPYAEPMPPTRKHTLYMPTRGDLRSVVGCVVRNPWERVASGYMYWSKRQLKKGHVVLFEDFLRGFEAHNRMLCGDLCLDFMRTPQATWTREATHVVRMETLQDGFNEFCEDARLPRVVLPKNNTSGSYDWRRLYTEDWHVGLVYDRFAEDIELFGYEYY